MSEKDNLIFIGELPPHTITGVSISNKINLEILKLYYNVEIVEEFYLIDQHDKFTLNKLINYFKTIIGFWNALCSAKFKYYYGVIYLSKIGILKNIITVVLFKIFNPEKFVILHFHRSDFRVFLKNSISLSFFKFLNLFVDKYILLSESQFGDFSIKDRHKLSVLYNTIENEIVVQKVIDNEVIKIVYLGNFIVSKGIYELIDSFAKLNYSYNIKLDLYGAFASKELEIKLKKLISPYPNIKIHGEVIGSDKMNILVNSDLIILPSHNEGLPLVLLESMYSGLPVIISNVGYINEALGDDYPLYCEPKNVDSIINAFIKFMETYNIIDYPDLLNKKYQKYSNESHKNQLLKLFQHENFNNNSSL